MIVYGRGRCAIERVHAGTGSTATAGLAGIESSSRSTTTGQLASAEGLPDASPRTIADSLPEHGGPNHGITIERILIDNRSGHRSIVSAAACPVDF